MITCGQYLKTQTTAVCAAAFARNLRFPDRLQSLGHADLISGPRQLAIAPLATVFAPEAELCQLPKTDP